MQQAIRRIQLICAMMALLPATALASDWDRGVSLYNKGDYRRALVEFQDIALERPDVAGAWYYIGLCEFKLKRYDHVELPLSHAIDLLEVQSPASADIASAWYTIGISHYLEARYEQAIEPLKRYLDLSQKAKRDIDPSARTALGRSYYYLDRFDEASVFLSSPASPKTDTSLDRAKENAANAYYLGAIYYKREDDDRAIQALQDSLKGNPEDPATMELLAESLMRRARKNNSDSGWLEAASVGEKLRAIRDDLKTANILGRAYLGAKKFESAVAPLEKLAKGNPDNGSAWLYYGIALSRSGQLRKAMEVLEITIQLTPESVPALSELAYVYETDKQYQQALRIYEKAYTLSGDSGIRMSMERVRGLAAQQP